MGEPKPLASLSAGLLARKGGARPAMRRQPLGSGPAPTNAVGYDDLGWNDMGYDVDPDQSGEPARMLDLKPFADALADAHDRGLDDLPDWRALRWELEEFRVSLFAQELGAKGGVSAKKLASGLPRPARTSQMRRALSYWAILNSA